jgi:hypothetical protein
VLLGESQKEKRERVFIVLTLKMGKGYRGPLEIWKRRTYFSPNPPERTEPCWYGVDF